MHRIVGQAILRRQVSRRGRRERESARRRGCRATACRSDPRGRRSTRSHGIPATSADRGRSDRAVQRARPASRVHQREAIGVAAASLIRPSGRPSFAVRTLKAPFTKRVKPRPVSTQTLPVRILEDAADEVAREAVPLGIDREARLLESHQTAIGADPQTVVDAPRNRPAPARPAGRRPVRSFRSGPRRSGTSRRSTCRPTSGPLRRRTATRRGRSASPWSGPNSVTPWASTR